MFCLVYRSWTRLTFQSIICVIAIQTAKFMGLITFRDFHTDQAKKCMLDFCFPIG